MSKVVLKSNDERIREGHEDGRLVDVLELMATDDILKLKLETLRGEMIGELIDVGADKFIAAARSLGWTDNIAGDLEP